MHGGVEELSLEVAHCHLEGVGVGAVNQEEQNRLAGLKFVADRLDEVVVDAEVDARSQDSRDGQAEDGSEKRTAEKEADEQTPDTALKGAVALGCRLEGLTNLDPAVLIFDRNCCVADGYQGLLNVLLFLGRDML